MPVWSIKIVAGAAGAPAKFIADNPAIPAGNPLLVFAGDLVSWNNTTGDRHQPWPTDSNFVKLTDAQVGTHGEPNYLSDEIPAHQSSTPSWTAVASPITAKTIFYCCKLHAQEHGKIIIT